MDETLDNQVATQTTSNEDRSTNTTEAVRHPLSSVQDVSAAPSTSLRLTEKESNEVPTQPLMVATMEPGILIADQEANCHAACSGDLADSQEASELVEARNIAHVDDVEVLPTVHRITGAERDMDVKSAQATPSKPLPTSSISPPANVTLFNDDAVPAKYSDAWKHHPDFTP